MDFRAVIFDLDGTLLDTLEDIADAMNSVLEARGYPAYETDAYRYFVGDGVNMLIKRALPGEKLDDEIIAELVKAYREAYGIYWKIKTQPYEGVPEMLDMLTARKLKLAVLSNKPDDFTKRCVRELLSRWTFHIVLGYQDGISAKPDSAGALQIAEQFGIPSGDILFLGDTSVDMKTAVAAGMYPVGALWGFRSEAELISSGANKVIERPQEILTLLGS
jgi:phosphoglycolate phosphatase